MTSRRLTEAVNRKAPNMLSAKFIGAWTLQSLVTTDLDGNETNSYGPSPIGQIVYLDNGRMGVHVMNPDAELPDFSGLTPSVALVRFAENFFAYWGTYTIDDRAGTVTHHFEGDTTPTDMCTLQVHEFESNLIWRVAELLHVPTRERLRLKKLVESRH